MLLLAHTGITLGVSALLSIRKENKSSFYFPRTINWIEFRDRLLRWPIYLGRAMDVRILLIGSLLPDIIDKPVGQILLRETFSSGKIFSHTLLFLVVITATGFYLYKRYNETRLLVLSFGTFMHLLLDQMWLSSRTLFWPIFGLAFDRADLTDWARNILRALFTNPEVYIPELIGMIVLIWFTIILLQQKKILAFLKYGRI